MTIRRKFLAFFLALAGIVSLTGIPGLILAERAKSEFSYAAAHAIPVIRALEKLRAAGLRVVASTNELAFILAVSKHHELENAAEAIGEEKRLIETGLRSFRESFAEYGALTRRGEKGLGHAHGQGYVDHCAVFMEKISRAGAGLEEGCLAMTELMRQGHADVATFNRKEQFEAQEKALLAAIDEAIAHEEEEFFRRKEAIGSAISGMPVAFFLSVTVTVLLFAASWFFLNRKVTRPLTELNLAINSFDREGFASRVDKYGDDEIGELAASFNAMAEKLETNLGALRKARAEVETLSGLLPICSFCKKIRDDKGYWNQIESYISRHSKALFSHGVCEECMKKHYPEFC